MSCPKCGDERIDHYSGKPWWIRGMGGYITCCPSCGHKLPTKRVEKRVLRGVVNVYKNPSIGPAFYESKELADAVVSSSGHFKRIACVEINQEYWEEVEE